MVDSFFRNRQRYDFSPVQVSLFCQIGSASRYAALRSMPRIASATEQKRSIRDDGEAASPLATTAVTTRTRPAYRLAFCLNLLALIAPIWTVVYLPWVDLSDHVARAYILRHYSDTPSFQKNFKIVHDPPPNLAIDFALPPLFSFLPVPVATKVFCSLIALLFAVGCHAVARTVHGTEHWLAIPASYFFYNNLLLYGLVNYMASIALFLLTLAAWLHFRRSRSVVYGSLAVLGGIATYFAHLSGFFFLCVAVGGLTALQILRGRRITLASITDLLPLAIPLALYASLGKANGDLHAVEWSSLKLKLIHAWTLFIGDTLAVDAIVGTALIVALGLVFWRGRINATNPVLLVAGMFWLAFAVFPWSFHTGYDADTRFIVPAAILTVTGLSIAMPRGVARLAYWLFLGALAFRLGNTAMHWQQSDAIAQQQAGLFRMMRPDSSLYSIPWRPDTRPASRIERNMQHFASYATILTNAVVPEGFSIPGQQPVLRAKKWPYYEIYPSTPLTQVPWQEIFAASDYIWTYGVDRSYGQFLLANCDLVGSAGKGTLYRVRR
jgi:hypothetical protein